MRLCVALVFVSIILTAGPAHAQTPKCETEIIALSTGAGMVEEPLKMTCAPGEEMKVFFTNRTGAPRRIKIKGLVCKDKSARNPTKKFVSEKFDLQDRETRRLLGASILPSGLAKAHKCDDGTFLYKYVVRMSDHGGDKNGKDRDPDLEVSPPPSVDPKKP